MVSKNSGLAKTVTPVLLRATDRWRQLWDKAVAEDELVEHKLCGWQKHAKEFWRLLRAIVDAVRSGDLNCQYMRSAAVDTSEALNEFIRKYEQARSNSSDS